MSLSPPPDCRTTSPSQKGVTTVRAQATSYTLDNRAIPGRIVVRADGRRPYIAETMHTAELFAQRLTAGMAIALPSETDSTKADQLYRLVDLLIEQRNQLAP